MTQPRIFISSTYFDLKYVRENLASFLENLGYDVVLHEKGDIIYGKNDPLERYAYKMIESCDFLIGIIGSRYGCDSRYGGNSITQEEITTARASGKKIFIFIQTNVYDEYNTYLKNKNNPNIQYSSVDNVKIFNFIETLQGESNNNYIAKFDSVNDIKNLVSSQLSGLFKILLDAEERRSTLFEGSKITFFRDRNRMIDYFEKIMDEATVGDVLWAQGVGHTAYTNRFQNRLTRLTNDGVEIHFITNKSSSQYEEFTSILKKTPRLKWVTSQNNKIRVFGLSCKCVIIALPSPGQYEAILVKDPYFTEVLHDWFCKKFNKLYKREKQKNDISINQ